MVILLVQIWSLRQLHYLLTHNSTAKWFSLFIITARGKPQVHFKGGICLDITEGFPLFQIYNA